MYTYKPYKKQYFHFKTAVKDKEQNIQKDLILSYDHTTKSFYIAIYVTTIPRKEGEHRIRSIIKDPLKELETGTSIQLNKEQTKKLLNYTTYIY